MATVCPCPVPPKRKTPFELAVKCGFVGGPAAGAYSFTSLVLVNAVDIDEMYVNNVPETTQNDQFTFDPTLGKIFRWMADGVTPNPFLLGDVIVIPYAKYV